MTLEQIKEYSYILYNNRSLKGVVNQSMLKYQKWNPFKLIDIERKLKTIKNKYHHDAEVEIDLSDLVTSYQDPTYDIDDVKKLNSVIAASHSELLNNSAYLNELSFLQNRNLTHEMIEFWQLGSMQYVIENTSPIQQEILGLTPHPMLEKLFDPGLEGGGIIFPLYENNKLINVTTRKISDVGKLKYTQAIPDLNLWGRNTIQHDEPIYIVEGLFDMIALHSLGLSVISVSSGMFSSLQLYQLSEYKNPFIHFCDNDRTGIAAAQVIKEFIAEFDGNSTIIMSKLYKDAAEHILEKNLDLNTEIEYDVEITQEIIDSYQDQTFNFTNYLKNRKF